MKQIDKTNNPAGLKNIHSPLSALIEHGIVRDSFFDESKAEMCYVFLTRSEIYQFAFGIVNASEKLRKSKHNICRIKKTAANNWTFERDKLRTEVLGGFHSDPEDLELHFPLNCIHPAIEICKPYLKDLNCLANKYSSANPSRHVEQDDYVLLKRIIGDLRIRLNQSSYNKAVNYFEKSSTNNEKSISNYLNELKKNKKELNIERMQLSFKTQSPMQPMGEFRKLTDPSYARRCEDFKENLLNNVVNAWKGILVGYISKTHYTHYWGFVVHLILIFDGTCAVTYGAPNLVGDHWSKVTQGAGKFETYKKYDENNSKFTPLRDFGIGYYGKKDKAKFTKFVEKVIIFLARTDKYMRFAVESPRIDSLKKGTPAMARAKSKSNGYDSSLPAIIQLKK